MTLLILLSSTKRICIDYSIMQWLFTITETAWAYIFSFRNFVGSI